METCIKNNFGVLDYSISRLSFISKHWVLYDQNLGWDSGEPLFEATVSFRVEKISEN